MQREPISLFFCERRTFIEPGIVQQVVPGQFGPDDWGICTDWHVQTLYDVALNDLSHLTARKPGAVQ